MANIGELFVRLRADTSNFEQGMSQAQATTGTFKAVISQNLSQIGQQMAQTGKEILSSIGGIVTTASEWSAQIQQQKFVYDGLNPAIQNAINSNKNLASSLGMTKQQYMNNTTATADFLARTGMSAQAIADQSGKLTTLTADMAAFADVPVDVAASDFRSALMGNFEVMDKYGVSLSVATIEQGSYAKEIGKSWNNMTQAEKAQATLNAMLEQGSSISGLAKQESGGFTMQLALMKQRLMESAAAIGEKLFPVLEPMIAKISEIAQNIANWANEHPKLTQAILMVIGVIGALMTVGGPLLMMFAGLLTVSTLLEIGMLPLVGIIAGVTAVIVALVAIGVALWQNWDTIKAKAGEIWNAIKTAIVNVVTAIVNQVKQDFDALKQNITIIWNAIKSVASMVWNGMKTVITNVVNTVKSKVTSIWNVIKSITSSVFNGIKSVTSSVWNGVKSTISNVVNGIKNTVSNAFNAVKSIATRVWNGVKSAIMNPINTAKSAVSRAMSAIKSAVNVLLKPRISLPHISVSGKFSINPPSVPKIGVQWYAKGGIMTRPTMFGMSGNTAHIGGEAGPEAILPLNTFYKHLDKKLDSSNNSDSIVSELIKLRKLIASLELKLDIDGREFTRTAVAPNKKELDNYDSRKVKFAY